MEHLDMQGVDLFTESRMYLNLKFILAGKLVNGFFHKTPTLF